MTANRRSSWQLGNLVVSSFTNATASARTTLVTAQISAPLRSVVTTQRISLSTDAAAVTLVGNARHAVNGDDIAL